MRSPSPTRRATFINKANAKSAVVSVSTPGVFVTGIFRALAAATSILLKPTPKFATTFKRAAVQQFGIHAVRMLHSSASRRASRR